MPEDYEDIPNHGALALRTLPKEGPPPKSRVKGPREAKADVTALIEANQDRYRRWAMVKGMFQGNPPYSSGKLRSSGQAWRFNIPTLEGKGMLSAGCAPYYDLFASGQYYAEIQTAEGTPEEQNRWSRIITEEWDVMIKGWREFDFKIWRLIADFVGYGRGFLCFDHPLDWRFKQISHENVLIPDGVEADIDELTDFVIRRKLPITELYAKIDDAEYAKQAGWSISEVRKAIRSSKPFEPQGDHYNPIAAQQQIADADSGTDAKDAVVLLAHRYVKEFSGKWSCYAVCENDEPKSDDDKKKPNEEPDFIYKSVEKYDHVNEILCPFIFEVLDNTWNGVRGLGADIFAIMQAKDRLRNSQLDNVIMRQSIILQAQKASDRQKIQLMNIGPVTIIPENCTAIQSSFIGDIEGTLAVNTDLNNMIQVNTGIYRPHLEKPQGNPRTATEATLDFQQSTILGGSAVNRFYAQLDPVYSEMYKRTVSDNLDKSLGKWAEDSLDFRKRCKDRGVPLEALRNVRRCRAWRSVGNGSPFLRQQALGTLAGFAASFPESGRVAWLRDMVSSVSNYTTTERYVPEPEIAEKPNQHVWEAKVENDSLKGGSEVSLTDTQNHVIHAQTHLEVMAASLQSLEAGADPITVLDFLESAGAHTAEHIQSLQGDKLREGDANALAAMLKEFAKAADKIRQQVQQMQKQGQQQQQAEQALPPEIALKQQEMLAMIRLKEMELQMRMQMEKERHALDMKIALENHNQELKIKDSEASAEIKREQQLTEAEIAAKKSKAKAEPASK